ncbi:MAG: tetratricopeptide repeat protein [Anaerolineae bacterium]
MPLPGGTVTFLFTDIVGSTQLLHELGDGYDAVFTAHQQTLRAAFDAHHGHEVDTQGDAFFVAFQRASDAIACAVAAQQALAAYAWPDGYPIEVRMGLHVGEPRIVEGHYVGLDVHRAARVAATGHGGQIVLSEAVYRLVADALPAGTTLRDLGRHRLKDLPQPEHLYDVLVDGLRQDFPPLKTLEARPHNLPIAPTPLIGREKELAAIEALVRRENVRLVTLIGPGGTGKTRLSLQVAMEVLEDFHDGVYFVDLSPITDAELVVSTIAQALGVREQGSRPLLDLLKDYLRDRQLLLLLDNFEQVMGAAKVVRDLLASARKVNVLVTSREVLGLPGEKEFEVPPLTTPDPTHLPPFEQMLEFEAVRLFVERAQDVRPDFSLTPKNAATVAEICYRLDGLPLAIELAAARMRAFSAEYLQKQLQRRLEALTEGPQDVPKRQRTLRSAIAWSYGLLEASEQALFRRLGVFVGGFSLEAAEAVCGGEGKLEVDEGILSLLEKSLIQRAMSVGDDLRYRMLETIREFAVEQMDEGGETDPVGQCHAHYYLALAELAEQELGLNNQLEWFGRHEVEHDNFRAALSRFKCLDESEPCLRLGSALIYFWTWHGYLADARDWVDKTTQYLDKVSPVVRARATSAAGTLANRLGEYDRAERLHREALVIYRQIGDRRREANSLSNLAYQALMQTDYDNAVQLFDESIVLFRRLGGDPRLAEALNCLGEIARAQGNYRQASAYYEESLAEARRVGDVTAAVSIALSNLGFVAYHDGDRMRATAFLRESLKINKALGLIEMIAVAITGLAGVYAAQTDAERAGRLLGAADAMLERTGRVLEPVDLADYRHILSLTRDALGDDRFGALFAEGHAMTLDEAVAYALFSSADEAVA